MATVSKYTEPKAKRLIAMNENDVFNYLELGEVSFVRWKRGMKSFEAIQVSTGKVYNCRTNLHSIPFKVVGIYIKDKVENDIDKLQPGDLFVIQNKNTAELFKFVEFSRSGKIKAVNPVYTEKKFTIDPSFEVTLIKKLM